MKLKLPAVLAIACAPFAQAELFFSEYVEGSGNNKALEIFNPTDSVIDLAASEYVLNLFSNGSATATTSQALTGSIGAGETYVVVTTSSSIDPALLALADETNSAVNHNGDDAFTLTKAGAIVDTFGQVGFDPGSQWEANGVGTQNQTLRRKSAVTTGDANEMDAFDPSLEWDEFAQDDFSDIGMHSTDGTSDDLAPTVTSTIPADGDDFVAVDSDIIVSFSEAVDVSSWNDVVCSVSGNHLVSVTGSGAAYTLNPDPDFFPGESCSFTISASTVSDQDGDIDMMAEDVTITFSTGVFPIVVNEFQADPAGDITGDANGDGVRDSGDDEFIELVNISGADLDVSGWSIADGASVRHVFPEGSIIAADCAAVVFGGGDPMGDFGGALVQTASTGAVGLNNSGDTITIDNGSAAIVVNYGGEGSSDQALTLNPDVTGTAFELHSDIAEAGGALFSPGTKLDGMLFDGCEVADVAPFVTATSPEDGAVDVSITTTIDVTFSEPVTVSSFGELSCSASGDVSLDSEQDGNTFTLTLDMPLMAEELCTLTIPAMNVTDLDGNADNMEADFVMSFTTVANPLSCDSSFTLISAIQGDGEESPMEDSMVNVKAVVTNVTPNIDAFYLQEEDADHDGNPMTSEGVFVFNPDGFTNFQNGDVVAISGLVEEFFDRTQITLAEAPVVCGQGVVMPVELSLPFEEGETMEPVEGMVVSFEQELVVTNTFELGRFGQAELSSQLRFNPTNQFLPGSPEAEALADLNDRDFINIEDANGQQNPDFVPFPTGGLSAANTLRLNDTVSELVGTVDYSFGDYLVQPVVDPVFTHTNPRPAMPELEAGELKVASFNVLNFFNGDGMGGGFPTSRGALTFEDFIRQADKIVDALAIMDADIVGLVEVENDGYGAESAIQELVDRLNAVVGADTYTFVNPGVSVIGTDEIAVGFIYKSAVVSLEGAAQILDSSNSIVDENGDPLFVDTKNRPALAQEFNVIGQDESLVVTVNHFKSKGSDCDELGDPDTGDGQGNCNVTRTRAAQALMAWLDDVYADKPVLVMGDLNAYAMEDPIMALVAGGYANLIAQYEGDHAYSFSFSGEVGYLDHAMANANLMDSVVDATEWHINSDEPTSLGYSTQFNSDFNDENYYAPDAYRSSDHDPVMISLSFAADEVFGDFDGDGDVDRVDIRRFRKSVRIGRKLGREFDLNRDGVIDRKDVFLLRRFCTRTNCAVND